jgi:hypothetical protein
MLLKFSSSLSFSKRRSLPGIQRIMNALSRIVSLGPGGVAWMGAGEAADAMLLLPRVCDERAEERPWAEVHPSMN